MNYLQPMRLLCLIIAFAAYVQFADSCEPQRTFITYSHNISKKRPVKKETSKIVFASFSNSGSAFTTTVTISRDSLLWNYDAYRAGIQYEDRIKLSNPDDFDSLIQQLAEITFKAKDRHDNSSGRGGYAYYFYMGEKYYFFYNSSFKLTGDYQTAEKLIQQFIETHQTRAQMMFKQMCEKPDRTFNFGVFNTLPQQFEQFIVKKH